MTGLGLSRIFDVMVEPLPSDGTQNAGTTVYTFPGRRVFTREEAARFLGITPRRMWFLEHLRCGPVAFSRGRYRADELDLYRTELFLRAGLPATEAARRSVRAEQMRDDEDIATDPFMDMATLHDVRDVGIFIIGRVAVACGLAVIVLSHTPLWHFLRHSLK